VSEVRIALDRNTWAPGETLQGHVAFESGTEPVESLEVNVFWRTEGKGDEDREVCGRWFHRPQENETSAIPFSVQLPMAPLSYEGVIVKIRWYAEVRMRQGPALTGLFQVLERLLPGIEHKAPFQLGPARPPGELRV
jgi:hypothetical protein